MKFLDCTLRDGGYYTNWDFDESLVDTYIESTNQLPIDYIEIGYRSLQFDGTYLGEYFYLPTYVMQKIRKASQKKIAVMLNEKEVLTKDLDQLLNPCIEYIDMIRLAVNPIHLERAINLAKEIKRRGFEVGFNIMYMSKWKDHEGFFEKLKGLEGNIDILNMVDSYGGVYPEEIVDTIKLVKQFTKVPLGFHGHNNLELGLINTLTAIENGVDIVDSTITGMGRGAGNLKTELLFTALKSKEKIEIDFNALSAVVHEFEKLQLKYGWGTNLPYMVSGANSLPQKDVMEWVTKRFYSINSIVRALENQSKGVLDNLKLATLSTEKKFENAIVVGGGPSAINHVAAIKELILKTNNVCIIHASSKNAKSYADLDIFQYFCLVGNEGYRMEKVLQHIFTNNIRCVLPPYPRKMGTYIPLKVKEFARELKENNFTNDLKDTHTAIALQAAANLGVNNIYLIGYDGYNEKITPMENSLSIENEKLFNNFKTFYKNIKLNSLTPTNYKELDVYSVYHFLTS